MLAKLKSRVEIYVFLIGAVGWIVWTGSGVKDEQATTKQALGELKTQQQEIAEAAGREFDIKLAPVVRDVGEIKDELAIQKSDINGISLATTDGAAARDRLLSGKVTAIQQLLQDVRNQQGHFVVAIDTIYVELPSIQAELATRPDTMLVFAPGDTIYVEKGTSWW